MIFFLFNSYLLEPFVIFIEFKNSFLIEKVFASERFDKILTNLFVDFFTFLNVCMKTTITVRYV